jgi:exodeoxyribonuclease VII small subunit
VTASQKPSRKPSATPEAAPSETAQPEALPSGALPSGAAQPEALPSEVDDELAKLSYEQARDALADVVRRLESGAETLEESLALWERGEALARHCEQWLAGAQARLDAARAPGPAS